MIIESQINGWPKADKKRQKLKMLKLGAKGSFFGENNSWPKNLRYLPQGSVQIGSSVDSGLGPKFGYSTLSPSIGSSQVRAKSWAAFSSGPNTFSVRGGVASSSDRNIIIGLDCPVCKNSTSENLDHFLLLCTHYFLTYLDTYSFPWKPPWVKEHNPYTTYTRLEWLLSIDRTIY